MTDDVRRDRPELKADHGPDPSGGIAIRTEAKESPKAAAEGAINQLSIGQIAVATLVVLGIVATAMLMAQLTRFLLQIFAAVVIGAIFDTIASFLCRRLHMPRALALSLAIVGLIALFLGGMFLFGSQLAAQLDTIKESIPTAVQTVQDYIESQGWSDNLRELSLVGSDDISRLLSQAGGYALAAGSGIADFLLILVGAIFLASDPATYRRGLLLMVPKRAVETADQTLDDVSHGLRGWMLGQSVSSLVVAVLVWLGLEMLGVPAAAGLGLIAGLLDVIPMIGPILAGIPAVLLAFTISPMVAVWTLLLYLFVQQLQGNFLQPMIQKHAVSVPPAVLLFAVIGAGLLFGFIGVLLSAPLTVVIFVVVQRIYVKTLLGKDIQVAGRE